MSHSLNEIEALGKKAARGAGMPWGMAEEASKALRWLCAHGIDGMTHLARLLERNDGMEHAQIAPQTLTGRWQAASGTLCPLTAGAALSDCAARLAEGEQIEMAAVAHPAALLPFAANAASQIGAPVSVAWDDIRVNVDTHGFCVTGPADQLDTPSTQSVICTRGVALEGEIHSAALRGAPEPEAWNTLHDFAHRTYAPATEESRLLGAGAGVSDND